MDNDTFVLSARCVEVQCDTDQAHFRQGNGESCLPQTSLRTAMNATSFLAGLENFQLLLLPGYRGYLHARSQATDHSLVQVMHHQAA
jgi:hypothetical protein